jgi:hypothetical protein
MDAFVGGYQQFWKNLLPPALDFFEMLVVPIYQNTLHHIP